MLSGLAALTMYLLSRLAAPGAHWPLWDVHVYWWGGQQAARGGALYAPGARYSFTYPPFAAALFSLAAHAPEGALAAAITAASIGALAALCALSLGAAGVRRRPETVFAVTALALLIWPVAYTLRLGEINLIVAGLAGADLLRRHDGHWAQGIATGLAAGIKLTPLIFVVYLLITRRVRAAATAAAAFAATVAVGVVLLPSPSRVFWLDGVFYDQNRIGDPANLSDQSLSGAVARLAGNLDPDYRWWAIASLLVGLAGIMVAAWAHRRGHRLAGVTCCAITGLLISPFSWTHHWVWAAPLLAALAAAAWRRRSTACGLAATAAAAVFSRRIPLSWPGHPPGLVRLLEGDLYVLCGLAVLAGTALALTRERALRAARSPGQTGAKTPRSSSCAIRSPPSAQGHNTADVPGRPAIQVDTVIGSRRRGFPSSGASVTRHVVAGVRAVQRTGED
jgi:alpha-1,2-mannosyltransferase